MSLATRVLIIDENLEHREMLEDLLIAVGYEPASCPPGALATLTIESFQPEILIVEWFVDALKRADPRMASEHHTHAALDPRFLGAVIVSKVEPTGKLSPSFAKHLVKPVVIDKLLATLSYLTSRTRPAGRAETAQ